MKTPSNINKYTVRVPQSKKSRINDNLRSHYIMYGRYVTLRELPAAERYCSQCGPARESACGRPAGLAAASTAIHVF